MWKNGFPRAGETMDLSVDKQRHKLKFLQEEVIVKNDYQV